MSASKDEALYGIQRQRKLGGAQKEISSSTSLSFTSQLSSLINAGKQQPMTKPSRHQGKKDDIFNVHNRNSAKRAKKDLEDSTATRNGQRQNGEPLDASAWQRTQRKMEEKARLYAAMKRGDVEDTDDRYAVDFDRKWAERKTDDAGEDEDDDDDDDDDDANEPDNAQKVEYVDEFGRTRTGTAMEAARAKRIIQGQQDIHSDRFTARPVAPVNVIYGDTIQHAAFNPDETRAAMMEEIARTRDKSPTPPPLSHFDGSKEIRTKGTAFFQFSDNAEERKQQMENLERERNETEQKRKQRADVVDKRRQQVEARRALLKAHKGKRKAEEFLDELGEELAIEPVDEMTKRIETAIANEPDEP